MQNAHGFKLAFYRSLPTPFQLIILLIVIDKDLTRHIKVFLHLLLAFSLLVGVTAGTNSLFPFSSIFCILSSVQDFHITSIISITHNTAGQLQVCTAFFSFLFLFSCGKLY